MCSSENSRFFPQWFLIHLGEETQFICEWELSARGFRLGRMSTHIKPVSSGRSICPSSRKHLCLTDFFSDDVRALIGNINPRV
jgi:hypothetical protein